jgi:hypothetical protein
MSNFDPEQYFQNKFGTKPNKVDSVAGAMEEKILSLRQYQAEVAAGRALGQADRSVADIAGDIGVTAVKSAIGVPEAFVGLADLASGGLAGKKLEQLGFRPGDAKTILDGMYSDAQKEANLRVGAADGFVDTLKTAIENPSTIATTVGESLGSMGSGALVARGLVAGAKMAPVLAGAVGEGVVGAGSAAEQIRQKTADGELTGKQSLSALASGAGTSVLGFAGGKLAQRVGLPDVDTMLAGGELKSHAGFIKSVVGAGVT